MKNFKKLSRETLKTVRAGEKKVYFADTSCGVQATTTQDWTPQQVNAWHDELEKNYCKTPVYSGSDPRHLATNL